MYSLVIKPHALQMMQEAYDWYEKQKSGLGDTFLSFLDLIFEKLRMHPEYFSLIKKNYRQVKLSRFPYVVVYEIMEKEVVVFAVFHTSRNPSLKF